MLPEVTGALAESESQGALE